jgi:hypothetical protein
LRAAGLGAAAQSVFLVQGYPELFEECKKSPFFGFFNFFLIFEIKNKNILD